MNIYLDWNVYNQIEKRVSLPADEKQVYIDLYDAIKAGKFQIPYSNAHLNDLIRGYKKNPAYIDGHLTIIEELSQNLCICQYWKQNKPLWHIRSVRDFFNSAIEEKESEWETFDDLIDEKYELSETISLSPLSIMKPLLQMKPVPPDFKKIYQADPVFSIIYPRTRTEMNEYALCCDMYNFSILLNKDFSLYRSLRKFLIQTLNKYRQNLQLIKTVNKMSPDVPKYLDMDALFEKVEIKKATGVESAYDKFFDIFFRFDLKGYKSDNQFPNMIDDALHSYYAAQCDYFITNDDRCKYKAEKTFERLKISTVVFTASEFAETILIK
jgi:hypothetical protein